MRSVGVNHFDTTRTSEDLRTDQHVTVGFLLAPKQEPQTWLLTLYKVRARHCLRQKDPSVNKAEGDRPGNADDADAQNYVSIVREKNTRRELTSSSIVIGQVR